jgi:hypothetical protein
MLSLWEDRKAQASDRDVLLNLCVRCPVLDHPGVMQVRTLPDVRVLSEFGAHGVSLPPGHLLEVQVEATPRSYGFICTLIMLDFGERVGEGV